MTTFHNSGLWYQQPTAMEFDSQRPRKKSKNFSIVVPALSQFDLSQYLDAYCPETFDFDFDTSALQFELTVMSPTIPTTEFSWEDFDAVFPPLPEESPTPKASEKPVVPGSPSEQLWKEAGPENCPTAPTTEADRHGHKRKQSLGERRRLSGHEIALPPSRRSSLASSLTSTEPDLHVDRSAERRAKFQDQTRLVSIDAAATTESPETPRKSKRCNSTLSHTGSDSAQSPVPAGSLGSPINLPEIQETPEMPRHAECRRHGHTLQKAPRPVGEFQLGTQLHADNDMYVEYADEPVEEFNSFEEQYRMTEIPIRFDIWNENGTQRTYWNKD